MKVGIRSIMRGKFVTNWDSPALVADRDEIGPGEEFELVILDAPEPIEPPVPPVIPTPPTLPPYATWQGTDRDWFGQCVYGKAFGQQTLLELEPTLNANGWKLTPPNANGERTKVHPPNGPWVRVGFGEGYWVWVEQP